LLQRLLPRCLGIHQFWMLLRIYQLVS
jgi:hypothetical protein